MLRGENFELAELLDAAIEFRGDVSQTSLIELDPRYSPARLNSILGSESYQETCRCDAETSAAPFKGQ